MGWLHNKQLDRASTPPGASTQDVAVMFSQLCKAVNQREAAAIVDGVTLTQWFYTGDGTSGASKTYPLASDWSGSIRGQLPKNALLAIKDGIEGLLGLGSYKFLTALWDGDPNVTLNTWTVSSVWTYATTGYTWQPTTNPLHPHNFIILMRALDCLKYTYDANIFDWESGGLPTSQPTVITSCSGSNAFDIRDNWLGKISFAGKYGTVNKGLIRISSPDANDGTGGIADFKRIKDWTASIEVGSYNTTATGVSGTFRAEYQTDYDATSLFSYALSSQAELASSLQTGLGSVEYYEGAVANTDYFFDGPANGDFTSGIVSVRAYVGRDLSGWLEDQT